MAAVCGSKRAFFEDLAAESTSPPVFKRLRCSSSSSPTRFSHLSPQTPSLLDHLGAVFPGIDIQLLERALEECGNDLDSAIKRLHQHCLGSSEENVSPAKESNAITEKGSSTTNGEAASSENLSGPNSLPVDGVEWVELLVKEMHDSPTMEVAKARATRVLETLEKSISARATEEASQCFHKQNMMLKEQYEAMIRDNTILKRAVAIQHERQKEFDDKNQELQHLKQLVSQYQEQMRTLEVNNYALTMHLKQAQQSSSMPWRFHPDVF